MATGCYTPEYLPGSFKGVGFVGIEATSDHGRRGAEGEFPFGENTAYADLGRRIRSYSIQGRFDENSHIVDASAFIAACESMGPGILIHPTRGAVNVACRSVKITDQLLEGQGVTTFSAEFVEANDWINGFATGAFLGGLSITTLVGAVSTFFQSTYAPNDAPFFETADITSVASEAITTIRQGLVEASTDVSDSSVSLALDEIQRIAGDNVSLSDPVIVFDTISQTMAAIDATAIGDNKLDVIRRIANWASNTPASSDVVGQSLEAVYSLVRVLSAGYAARASLESDPRTLDEGLRQFDIVTSILEQEYQAALNRCDNCMFLSIREFTTDAQSLILNKAYELPALVSYDFRGGVHSLVAAHEIYCDATQSRDLERRNPYSFPWNIGPEVIAARA